MTVLEQAGEIITGARREAYGDVSESFEAIAAGWSQILGETVTAREVALCMVWLKVVRESYSHQRDNLVDICGYAALIEQLTVVGQ